MSHPLLGKKPSRRFKIFREDFPAIFRFNGQLFLETVEIETGETKWLEIAPKAAEQWLNATPVKTVTVTMENYRSVAATHDLDENLLYTKLVTALALVRPGNVQEMVIMLDSWRRK